MVVDRVLKLSGSGSNLKSHVLLLRSTVGFAYEGGAFQVIAYPNSTEASRNPLTVSIMCNIQYRANPINLTGLR